MLQQVIENMPSPFGGGQSVLTLACGQLWAWNTSKGEAPAEIDCIHCDDPPQMSEELATLDLMVRNLRRKRAGLQALEPLTPKQLRVF